MTDQENIVDVDAEAIQNGEFDFIPDNVISYFKLPEVVKRRINALKNLQYKTLEIDTEFYHKLYVLEKEFESRHQELFDKRAAIVQGKTEPSEMECDFKIDTMEEYRKLIEDVDKLSITAGGDSTETANGIPDFWLKALKHDSEVAQMIMEHDEPVLKHLVDIRCELSSDTSPGFTLDFYFSPNEWFANEKLSKTYFFAYEIPKDHPFEYTGPEIVAAQGCAIDWNKGKDLTVKEVKKMQKNKHRPAEKRVVTKQVMNDSFFNFFDAEKKSIDNEDNDPEFLELDFKIGQFIRESLIPRAVLYFTGEAPNDDEDDFDDDDDEDDDDDDEESDEEEEEVHLSSKVRRHQKGKRPGQGANNEECKQQ